MAKITFMGAGSCVFAKNILGDSLLSEALRDSHIALYDIDGERLQESKLMLDTLNANLNRKRAKITAHLGEKQRRSALKDATFVVNAIQVGGYEPCTVTDFEIPKKYGLRQTIADTLGIGGIFRALRTIPVMDSFAREMEAVCPDAWMLNYTNPMSMLTGYLQRHTAVKTVGLCHSVQVCADTLLDNVGLGEYKGKTAWKIAGINHMSWLLEIRDRATGKDLYPEIKKRAAKLLAEIRKAGGSAAVQKKHSASPDAPKWAKPDAQMLLRCCWDHVRMEMMLNFGCYITESSEHNAEYHPYFIKSQFPELIDLYGIPLDEYPRRCVNQIASWKKQRDEIVHNHKLTHERTHEYGSYIMEAIVTDRPCEIGGNVLNTGLIPNLPADACVEVPCLVNRNGVQGCHVGNLPPQLMGLNMSNVPVQLLTIEAAATRRKEAIYQAALLDPHTRDQLTIDQIKKLCDELIAAHTKDGYLPTYR